jgi:homoserine kinase type II
LFDFDWSKVDVRCFDVALAITYFCSIWEGHAGGSLHMGKTAIFFHAYQQAGATGVIPLSEPEIKYLPHMIRAANIYVMNWVIQDFYNTKNIIDPCNHIKYLQHYGLVLQWLEKDCNFNELEKLL